jgi:hypothetical protein
MTREEQIAKAAKDLCNWRDKYQIEFIRGAEWADANNDMVPKLAIAAMELEAKLEKSQAQLDVAYEQLAIANRALNKLGMLQMGGLDYTQDFFEITKSTVRNALADIKAMGGGDEEG